MGSSSGRWNIGPPEVKRDSPVRRPDLAQPPCRVQRASLPAALAAAQPNERQKSLDALDADVLARSTNPMQIRTFLAICRAWEVEPCPLTVTNIRFFGASMKLGGYRSAAVYYQAVCSHQQPCLRTPIPSIIKCCVRDCVRSILRGLGATKLKDSFNALCIGDAPVPSDDSAFDFGIDARVKDLVIICVWFMLRESEMANACLSRLSLVGDEAQLLSPIHTTEGYGKLTVRSLRCSCRMVQHKMCVWHAAERHLVRVHQHAELGSRNSFPLFPAAAGRQANKSTFIASIRRVVDLAGIPLIPAWAHRVVS